MSTLSMTCSSEVTVKSKDQSGRWIKWLIAVLALCLVPVLIGLGFWQLDRADQKQQLIDQWQTAVIEKGLPDTPKTGVRVQLRGSFDTMRSFLLDNRTRDGRVGYEVIALFSPEQDVPSVLVNLGWVEADIDRSVLPMIDLPEEILELTGHLVLANGSLVLAPQRWTEKWPLRIQSIELEEMQKLLGIALYPALLRVSEPIISGLETGWKVVNMPPEKHLGYALQWFGLAFVLVTGIAVVVTKQRFQRGRRRTV